MGWGCPVKFPVPNPEKSRSPFSHATPPPEPGPRRSEERDFKPRYVALPERKEVSTQGRRNLVIAIVALGCAAVLLGVAIYLAGAAALMDLAGCLATATLLYIMARARLFRQRNGALLAWAGVALLGVVLVFAQSAFLRLSGGTPARTVKAVAAQSESTAALKPEDQAMAMNTGLEPTLLKTAFPQKADANSGPMVRIARDISVIVSGRPYMAKAGDTYPLVDVDLGEIHFSVDGHEITIPSAAAEVMAGTSGTVPEEKFVTDAPPVKQVTNGADYVPPTGLSFDEQVKQSQIEAVRRYPALGKLNSTENRLFITARNEQKFSGETEFFKNPNWPLTLARILAHKEGWKRADGVEDPPLVEPKAGGDGAAGAGAGGGNQ